MQITIEGVQSQAMAVQVNTIPSYPTQSQARACWQLLAVAQISVECTSGVLKLAVVVCRVDKDFILLICRGNSIISIMAVSGLEDMGIIHMNGRVYDSRLGRFLQADPHIQAPFMTQSLNRYSYVLNNPLNATDPSGFFFKQILGLIAAIVIGVVLGPIAVAWAGTLSGVGTIGAFAIGGAITGFVAGFAS